MIPLHETVPARGPQAAYGTHPDARRPAAAEPLDPVIRAVMACDGIGRDKTIALVLSAVEAAFPS